MTGERQNDAISTADYEALANLRYILRRFIEFSASAAQAEGLPSQQHQALLAIKAYSDDEPMTVGMLAGRLLIAPHSATELLDRLGMAGLVVRHSDPDDRRRQTLTLTQKAEAMLLRLSTAHLSEIRDMAPELITILQRLQQERR